MVCILTQPDGLHETGVSPIGVGDTGNVVFCCFFLEPDARTALLEQLRYEAGQSPVEAHQTDSEVERLSRQYERFWQSGDAVEAVVAVIRWRALILRRGYHTYTLTEGCPPYRYGCIISFEALNAEQLRATLDKARTMANRERERIMDVFGWGLTE